jgi:hypothetical protein
MAPKATASAEEDEKFLLTIIKQLDGTVSIPIPSNLHASSMELRENRVLENNTH